MTKYIQLTKGFNAIVDNDEYQRCIKHKWYACFSGKKVYARTYINDGIKPKWIRMHRFICHNLKTSCLDHINGNGLDNRKCNLRASTHSQNMYNSEKRKIYNGKKSSSKFKGVSWFKPAKLWISQIGYKGKLHYIGYFTSEIEAAKAYDKKAKELFGEFAKLNFP